MKINKILFMIFILFLIITTSKVKATEADYGITIDQNNNINIEILGNENDPDVSNFANHFTYENHILTIKENTRIVSLKSDVDITITSNDKPVIFEKIDVPSNGKDIHFTIKNLNISATRNPFVMIGSRMSAEIIDSHFNIAHIQMYDDNLLDNNKERLLFKNTKIDTSGVIRSYAHLKIIDSTLNIDCLEDRGNNLTITNSKLIIEQSIANYSTANRGITTTKIIDSEVECKRTNCLLGNGNGQTPPGILEITNSKIKNFYIENMRSTEGNKSYTKITNSHFENLNIIHTLNPLHIKDSNITVEQVNVYSSDPTNNNNGVFLEDSTLKVSNFMASGKIHFNNSYVESDSLMFYPNPMTTEIKIQDSYVRLKNKQDKPSFYNANLISIHNSNFLAENDTNYIFSMNRTSSEYTGATFEIDNYLKLVDKNDVFVHLVGKGNYDQSIGKYDNYYLMYENNETYPKSLKLISTANIRFKIINGTWQDDTSDDILVTKDVWTKLENKNIPKNMKGRFNGHWEVEPNTTDYIKKNITYTYVFDEKDPNLTLDNENVNGWNDGNPPTGTFISISLLICLNIFGICLLIYYKKKKKFKKI